MKVLFVIDSLCRGGKERRLIELAKSFKQSNIEFNIVVLTPIIEFEEELKEINVKPIVIKRIIRKDPLVFYKLYKICKKYKPTVINTWGLMPSVYSIVVAKYLKISFVNSMIIDSPVKLNLKNRILSKLLFKYSDIITANSISGLKAYNVNRSNVKVIYNGFNFNRLKDLEDPDKLRNKFNISTKFIVGMVAGFRHHKDHRTLIKAAKIILKQRSDVTFLLVGDGPTLETCKEIAFGFNDIKFTGNCSDVESIMNICDIGILSTFTEGISNAIIEFMALGKPVIATDGGGTKELVINESTGYLTPQKSPIYLSEKIDLLLSNKPLRDSMGIAAKKRIENEFSIDQMKNNFLELFENRKLK